MKQRWAALLLALTVLCALLTGCTEENQVVTFEDTGRAVTTITFFGNKYEPENVRVIEEILSGFMKENPDIRVSYESLKGTDYFDALEKRMASGKGDDVFMVNHDVLLELKKNGQVADLSGLSAIPRYTEAMLAQMTETDGKIYWVPTTVSVFGLYCNMDILNAYGQKVPQNLEEWKQTCSFFIQQGVTPIIANNDISLKTLAIGLGFDTVYQQNRQDQVFARLNSGEEYLSDYLRPGFALAASFISQGYIDAEKTLHTKKTSDDLQEFAKGNTPFMLTGVWAAGRLDEMSLGFTFELAPLPLLADDALLVINADTRLSVNADSEHLDAAIKFTEYFTRSENIQKFAAQQSSFSPLADGAPSSVEYIRPLIPCYQAGRVVFGADSKLTLPIWHLTAEVSQKLLAGESLDAALAWLDQQTEEAPPL